MAKSVKLFIILITIAICALFTLLIIMSIAGEGARIEDRGDIQSLKFNGNYTYMGETYGDLSSVSIKSRNQELTAEGKFDSDIEANETLMFHVTYFAFTMEVNGIEVFSYGYDHPSWVKTGGNAWVSYTTDTAISSDDVITFNFVAPNGYVRTVDYQLFLRSMYTGSEGGLYYMMLQYNGFGYVTGTFFIICGVALAIISIIIKSNGRNYLYIALLMFCFGIWIMSDIGFLSLILPYPHLNDIIVYGSIMISAVFSIEYTRTFFSGKKKEFYAKISSSIAVVIVSMLIMQLVGLADLYYMMQIFYGLIIVIAIALFAALCIEYNTIGTKSLNSKITMVSFAVYLVSVICDCIIYYMGGNTSFIYTTSYGILAFAIGQFIIMIREIGEYYKRKELLRNSEKELLESKINLMLNQIQPHFLYNSLTTIRYLVSRDSMTAEKAIEHFAKFLRENTDAISSNSPIPFEQEIEHLDNYLYLEKLRFGDIINIKYEFQTQDFMLPAITIQPLVENAIKYGITKKRDGGTVIIKTSANSDCYLITIIDDGVGFDIDAYKRDGKAHVGIDNVRSRLALMSGGTLTVVSTPDSGTTATIRLPKGTSE